MIEVEAWVVIAIIVNSQVAGLMGGFGVAYLLTHR
jgi:hypothetical protein